MTRLLAPLAALVRRPDLWLTAARLAVVLAPAGPRRLSAYLRFRNETMFGADAARLSGEQLVDHLAWCAMMRGVAQAQRRAGQSTAVSRTER